MLDYPACNFVIHSSPLGESNNDYYHWHVELMPKLVRVAGFEWGTGFYINLTPSEEFAKLLREGWYNLHRRHSSLENHSPANYERRYDQASVAVETDQAMEIAVRFPQPLGSRYAAPTVPTTSTATS